MTADLREDPPRTGLAELEGLALLLGVVVVLTALCAVFL